MHQLLPAAGRELTTDQMAELYAYPTTGGVRANMVTPLDGAVTADGKTDSISGPADKLMFGLLRALADVVVVGANTVRIEEYGPGRSREQFAHLRTASNQPPAPTMAVVTRSANLDPTSRLFTQASVRSLVITCESAPLDKRRELADVAHVLIAGDAEVDPAAAFRQLRDRGLSRILTEGGPHWLGQVVQAGALDELALAVSPLIVGGDAGRIVQTHVVVRQRMHLKVLLQDSGFLFGLYTRTAEGT
jgi:riboflavin biosynthesis pyrimidine reductase